MSYHLVHLVRVNTHVQKKMFNRLKFKGVSDNVLQERTRKSTADNQILSLQPVRSNLSFGTAKSFLRYLWNFDLCCVLKTA